MIAYARLGEDRDPPVVVVINFTPVVRDSYRVGTPRGGRWMELLNSDSASYGGGNVGNFGSLDAEPVGVGQQDFSLRLTLPPLAALVLVATDGAS